MTDQTDKSTLADTVEALRDQEPAAYLYKYSDPISGRPVWRREGGLWNGQTSSDTRALYSVEQIAALNAAPGQEAAATRIKQLEADLAVLMDVGGRLLEWWPANSETGSLAGRLKGSGFAKDVQDFRAVLSRIEENGDG